MKPYFSIVIPLYNKEDDITKTIASVVSQTCSDFEIIIINDGSTDNSLQKIEAIKDRRMQVFTTENNGVSHARNYGIKQSSSERIAFLDADDMWEPHHLEDLKLLCETFPNCGMYCKAYQKQKGDIKLPSVFNAIPTSENWKGIVDDYFASSAVNAIAWTSAVMVPKNILQDLGGFDESITLGAGEDTDLWIRIALNYDIAFHNKVSAIHNLNAGNRITNSNTNDRQFLNLDKFDTSAKTNASLQKYLDLNRFSIGLQYKLVGNTTKAKSYINKINKENLNLKQRILIRLNPSVLKHLISLQSFFNKKGIYLSAFR